MNLRNFISLSWRQLTTLIAGNFGNVDVVPSKRGRTPKRRSLAKITEKKILNYMNNKERSKPDVRLILPRTRFPPVEKKKQVK